ncbi:MAG: hypothetical protein K1W20_03480 [Lachnospiraceae bacterium]
MTLDQRVLNLIKKYMEKLFQKKVLTSMEEVAANTNETNLVAAPVVAELNDKLKGFEPVCDSSGKITGYKTAGGADTVFPFSTNYRIYYKLRATGPLSGFPFETTGYFDIINGRASKTSVSASKKIYTANNMATEHLWGTEFQITRVEKL